MKKNHRKLYTVDSMTLEFLDVLVSEKCGKNHSDLVRQAVELLALTKLGDECVGAIKLEVAFNESEYSKILDASLPARTS